MKKLISASILLIVLAVLAACEKYVYDDSFEEDANLWISTSVQTESYTKSVRPLGELCSKISFAIYQDGVRVKYVNQKTGDSNFGNVALSLAPGHYSIVIIGHSGASSATTTNINKIAFSSKVTDNFLYCEEMDIDDTQANITATLKRTVAMFRLVVTDDIPDNVARIKFYYTGGSSTLDAATGLGCVESRQTEYREVTDGQKTFDIYTFPHSTTDHLKITITALDADDNPIAVKELNDVEVTVNMITRCTGNLFDGSGGTTFTKIGFDTNADDEWDDIKDIQM